MNTGPEARLEQNREEPIEPALPLCDPHHHLWDRPGSRYLLEDLLKDVGGSHHVIKTVYIECGSAYREDGPESMKPVGETEFIQKLTSKNYTGKYGKIELAAGIVGFVDLTLGDAIEPVLGAHIAAGKGRFRGIRYTAAWDPNPEMRSARPKPPRVLLDSKFRQGFACLRKYPLSFDVVLNFHQLMELVDLAKIFSDVTIILNHIGYPSRGGPYAAKQTEVLGEWRRSMAALALCPNVMVKLGGLGMPRLGFGWSERAIPPGSVELAETMSPYFLYCIEQFGINRCMFESNFPPDKDSYSYVVMWNAFKRFAGNLSPVERDALLIGTATRVYRL